MIGTKLDNLTGGRVVVGFLRDTVNEDQTFSVNPTETRGRPLESMEFILKAMTEPQPFGWEGRFYQFRTVAVWPRPLQQPLPPTYVLTRSAAVLPTGRERGQERYAVSLALQPHLTVIAKFYSGFHSDVWRT